MSLLKLLIIGHGSQAKAWASNLKKSGHECTIYLREESKSIPIAEKNGFSVLTNKGIRGLLNYDCIILLTPDDTHEEIISILSPYLKNETKLVYAHGFSLHSRSLNKVFPKFSHLLLAPKAIASEVKCLFEKKKPIPAAYSLEFSKNISKDSELLMLLAQGVGMTGNLVQTTFKEEMICDLFSEQSLLCSALPFIMKKSYDSLTEAGVSRELAFLECCIESKFIINTILGVGFNKFFEMISPNALIGAEHATNRLFDEEFQKKLNELLGDISDNSFLEKIKTSNVDTIRKKMVSLYSEGDIEDTRKSLSEFI